MELLTILTLIYAGILVLAVAASLIIILYYLWRIGSSLQATQEALDAVAGSTAPLEEPMALLSQRSADWAQTTSEAQKSLHNAKSMLQEKSGQPAAPGAEQEAQL